MVLLLFKWRETSFQFIGGHIFLVLLQGAMTMQKHSIIKNFTKSRILFNKDNDGHIMKQLLMKEHLVYPQRFSNTCITRLYLNFPSQMLV